MLWITYMAHTYIKHYCISTGDVADVPVFIIIYLLIDWLLFLFSYTILLYLCMSFSNYITCLHP